MVTFAAHAAGLGETALVAAPAPGGPDAPLPPTTQAAAQMALLGIALLGMLLVVIILLGGHWVRRQGNVRRGPVVPPDRAPLSSRQAAAPAPDDAPLVDD